MFEALVDEFDDIDLIEGLDWDEEFLEKSILVVSNQSAAKIKDHRIVGFTFVRVRQWVFELSWLEIIFTVPNVPDVRLRFTH